jgi:hypothetical protein
MPSSCRTPCSTTATPRPTRCGASRAPIETVDAPRGVYELEMRLGLPMKLAEIGMKQPDLERAARIAADGAVSESAQGRVRAGARAPASMPMRTPPMITVIFEFTPKEGKFQDYMRIVDTLREDLGESRRLHPARALREHQQQGQVPSRCSTGATRSR